MSVCVNIFFCVGSTMLVGPTQSSYAIVPTVSSCVFQFFVLEWVGWAGGTKTPNW